MTAKEQIVEVVLKKSQMSEGQRKLSCAQAFVLAQEMGTTVLEIGRICNEQNIKICACQLGCFK
ncbi:MAG: hypothetical protein Q7T18_10640 [Sedimentisphaerales bacterium]|nr:hypothetical protein [Sedimentisphaerales bacterium]